MRSSVIDVRHKRAPVIFLLFSFTTKALFVIIGFEDLLGASDSDHCLTGQIFLSFLPKFFCTEKGRIIIFEYEVISVPPIVGRFKVRLNLILIGLGFFKKMIPENLASAFYHF